MSTVPDVDPSLHHGHMSGLLDGLDARYLRYGEREVVRRAFVAVRDVTWKTVPEEVLERTVREHADGVEVAFTARYVGAGVDVTGQGRLELRADGLRFTVTLTANADTEYARMGLCILHPCELLAGRSYLVRGESGPRAGRFPDTVIGAQEFRDGIYHALLSTFSELEIDMDGVRAHFAFEGDVFELEDQRNWTDASFKTYSTALSLGYPHELRAGESITQTATLTCRGPVTPRRAPADRVAIAVGPPVGHPLPPLGLGTASHGRPLTSRETELLRALELDHLRVEADLTAPDWSARLAAGVAAATSIGAGVELAVFVNARARRQLSVLADVLAGGTAAAVRRLLVFHPGTETTPVPWVPEVRAALDDVLGDTPLAGGTNLFFTEINRGRPDVTTMEGVAWSINASVHATDDRSVMETLAAQGDQVVSARTLWPRTRRFVGPVTLRMRWNAHARGFDDVEEADALPFPVDVRQALPFVAAWTVGSVGQLTRAGVDALTYFETTGWRGLIESETPDAPQRFPSTPGQVFPVYDVFAALAGWRGAEVLAVDSAGGLRVQGLALRRGDAVRAVVANLTPDPQPVDLAGLDGGGRALELAPYEVAVVDAAAAR